jgi:site-specific recombinase XerD
LAQLIVAQDVQSLNILPLETWNSIFNHQQSSPMNAKLSILFYGKTSKTTAGGLLPIYLRVTISGQRIEISTQRYVEAKKWSKELGKMKGTNEEARSFNSYLDILKAKVYDHQRDLIHAGIEVTAETMKDKLLNKPRKIRTIIPIFQQHNTQIETLIGREYAKDTLTRYQTSLKHTQEFIQWKFNKPDIDILSIDHAFVADYDFYLRSVRKCANNSAVKYLKNFKKIIRICIANGWLDRDPFVNYKTRVKQVDRVFLTQEEIDTLSRKVFIIDRLNLVRDVFLFSCYTGLAYIDVKKLTPDHLVTGIDGEKWIYTYRQKTNTPTRVPLLPVAAEIITKYSNHPPTVNRGNLLPILSNQKMNAYLKELAAICQINKELTFHSARHTFATTITLTNGVPIESVSKMLGHTNIRTTQHYAKILDKKLSQDIQQLKAIYAGSRVDDTKQQTG